MLRCERLGRQYLVSVKSWTSGYVCMDRCVVLGVEGTLYGIGWIGGLAWVDGEVPFIGLGDDGLVWLCMGEWMCCCTKEVCVSVGTVDGLVDWSRTEDCVVRFVSADVIQTNIMITKEKKNQRSWSKHIS